MKNIPFFNSVKVAQFCGKSMDLATLDITFFLNKEINPVTQHGHIKLIKNESKDVFRHVSWTPNQHIRMISEGSCDTENWSNDAENSAANIFLPTCE